MFFLHECANLVFWQSSVCVGLTFVGVWGLCLTQNGSEPCIKLWHKVSECKVVIAERRNRHIQNIPATWAARKWQYIVLPLCTKLVENDIPYRSLITYEWPRYNTMHCKLTLYRQVQYNNMLDTPKPKKHTELVHRRVLNGLGIKFRFCHFWKAVREYRF